MDSIRQQINDELNISRLDKTRLYKLLLQIVENTGAGGVGVQGPIGPTGPQGPVGPRGPACACKCVSKDAPVKTPAKAPVKKAPVKKKVTEA